MTYHRYRIWKMDGTYEVAVAHNRDDALREAKERYHIKDKDIHAVGIVKGNGGRLFIVNEKPKKKMYA